MTIQQTKKIIQILTKIGISFESGLTDEEVMLIEAKFNLTFPPDLKLFLQIALPTTDGFVDWRLGLVSGNEAVKIFELLEWPLEGMLFDLEFNDFWIDNWGTKPFNYVDKVLIAKRQYETYPKLIPIYSHRYIPCRPNEIDNPVFSVYQMDIVYYGYNLATYFANEFHFHLPSNFEILEKPKHSIEFWSEFVG